MRLIHYDELAFGRMIMKTLSKSISILALAAVLVATSCSTGCNTASSTISGGGGVSSSNSGDNNNGENTNNKTLAGTICMTVPNWLLPTTQIIADEFSHIHPDVKITLSTYNFLEFRQYRESIRFPIMSGQGLADDIVQSNCFTPWDYLKQDWMFVDLLELMENDPGFIIDDYYMNVFEGLAVNGKLFEFPIDFLYLVIGISSDAPAEIIERFKQFDAITFSEVFDLYFDIQDRGDRYVSGYIDAQLLFQRNLSAFIDFENRTCNVNSPRFVKLISDAKNATNPEKVRAGRIGDDGEDMWMGFLPEAEMKEYAAKHYFHISFCTNYQLFMPTDEEKTFTHFIPLLSESGKLGIQSAVETWSIPTTSKNKEVAWEFLKFMATKEGNKKRLGDQMFVQFVPNKDFFRYNLPITLENFAESSIRNYGAPLNSFRNDAAGHSTKIVDMFDRYNQMPMEWYWLWDSSLSGYVHEIFRAFYADTITAEQAASELHNRVSLLLME